LALGYERTSGVVVVGVSKDSPGVRSGLERGDIITRIGSQTIETAADLEVAFIDYFVGDAVDIDYVRRNKNYTTRLLLKEFTAP
jgi:S1-C subfamily serine protease